MRQTITPARKLSGELRVPGEASAAAEALVLASLSEGESRIEPVPPEADPLLRALGQLGVRVELEGRVVKVMGRGLRGLKPSPEILDLTEAGSAAVLLLAGLTGQEFDTRVRLGEGRVAGVEIARRLAASGAVAVEDEEGVFTVRAAGEVVSVDHPEAGLDRATKLSLLLAGLFGDGSTTVREAVGSRDRPDQALRSRGVELNGSRQDEPPMRLISVAGGQALQPLDVDVAGDLRHADALIVAALTVKGSKVRIRRVAISPETRVFLDLVRQIGGRIEVEEADGAADLVVSYGPLKSTRVAEKRAERLLDHVPLLAVLATQTEGEFIIRDIDALRRDDYDRVGHLVSLLRQIDAKVGEYPEGIVIDGGHTLRGSEIDSRGDAALAQAFAVAGLLADGDMVIDGAECVDEVFPGFFTALDGVKQEMRR